MTLQYQNIFILILEQSPWKTDQDSPRTRQMIEGFDQFDFPVEPERFGNLKIYVRKD